MINLKYGLHIYNLQSCQVRNIWVFGQFCTTFLKWWTNNFTLSLQRQREAAELALNGGGEQDKKEEEPEEEM